MVLAFRTLYIAGAWAFPSLDFCLRLTIKTCWVALYTECLCSELERSLCIDSFYHISWNLSFFNGLQQTVTMLNAFHILFNHRHLLFLIPISFHIYLYV